jgi:hypothetical protein
MSIEVGDSTVQVSVEPPVQGAPVPKRGQRRGNTLLRLGLTFAALFLGYKVVPFYYYYFEIKSNCVQVLRNAAVRSDEELRREWLDVVRSHGIDKEPRDIGIQRIGGRVKMWLNYQEPLDVFLMGRRVTLYSFDFTPSADVEVEE